MIHLLSISKAFQPPDADMVVVFRPTTLSIPVDRRVGILGGPRVGKSTLLQMLTGSQFPSEGQIVSSVRLSPILGTIGLLNAKLTGVENAAYLARLHGLPTDTVLEAAAVLSQVEDEWSKPVWRLSAVMRQWLLFCIVCALGPECLVADETLAGREAFYADKARGLVLDGLAGKGLIIASRKPETIRSLCEVVVVIKDGTLYPFDDVEEGIRFFEQAR